MVSMFSYLLVELCMFQALCLVLEKDRVCLRLSASPLGSCTTQRKCLPLLLHSAGQGLLHRKGAFPQDPVSVSQAHYVSPLVLYWMFAVCKTRHPQIYSEAEFYPPEKEQVTVTKLVMCNV